MVQGFYIIYYKYIHIYLIMNITFFAFLIRAVHNNHIYIPDLYLGMYFYLSLLCFFFTVLIHFPVKYSTSSCL